MKIKLNPVVDNLRIKICQKSGAHLVDKSYEPVWTPIANLISYPVIGIIRDDIRRSIKRIMDKDLIGYARNED